MNTTSTTPNRARRRLAAMAAVGAALAAGCAPQTPSGPKVVGQPCDAGEGVTVVVDFQKLNNTVAIGCAPGTQASGLAALTNAGFTYDEIGGFACQINSLPVEGYPTCQFDAYWSYNKSDGTSPWDYSMVGASSGPIAVDSLEGWSYSVITPDNYDGAPIRLSVEKVLARRG
ncbi:MAG: hypothetical protein M9952_09835 [Microthrixaceae bacterium]|nr:hypothetical protein [Microthrixaceae bacterium]